MRRFTVVITARADRSTLAILTEMLGAETLDLDGVRIGDITDRAHKHMTRHKPDVVVILGDRTEALGAAMAATYNRIPIAHIHGGETTRGAFDNQIRDAVTKLSHLHFVAAPLYRDVVRFKLCEDASRIYMVGSPCLDRLSNLPPREVKKAFVVTWHPVTLCVDESVEPVLEALAEFPDYEAIWTVPNNDPGALSVARKVMLFKSMDAAGYLDACRSAAAVVGNSSSGIIEAPTLEVPSVSIGRRQEGRLHGRSVISCPCVKVSIVAAIRAALDYHGPFPNPYGKPGASARIAEILKTADLDGILIK